MRNLLACHRYNQTVTGATTVNRLPRVAKFTCRYFSTKNWIVFTRGNGSVWTHPYGVVIIGKVGISVYSNSSRIVLIAIEEYIFGLLKDLNTRKPHRSMFRNALRWNRNWGDFKLLVFRSTWKSSNYNIFVGVLLMVNVTWSRQSLAATIQVCVDTPIIHIRFREL